MTTPFLFIIAILTPVMLAITIFVPPYAGIFGAADIIYATGTHPQSLTGRVDDVFYIIDVYSKLFTYWSTHIMQVSFLRFTLPLLGLPAIGLFAAYWITRKAVHGLRNLFHMTTRI
jgi:hypothetical protein